tara:strand:+ start:1491 stop:1727 length:237 start_codon:yes stop_codon:yes gene_type:complete
VFEVGDLVTVDSDTLRLHVHQNVHDQWSTNELGIVVGVEGYKGGATVLVKVHFQSLGGAYWLYAHEVIHINSQILDKK